MAFFVGVLLLHAVAPRKWSRWFYFEELACCRLPWLPLANSQSIYMAQTRINMCLTLGL